MSMLDYVEIKEKANGSWVVNYPDESFIPCSPTCAIKHKHDYDQKLVESFYKPKNYKDAQAWAKELAGGRKIKTVKYEKNKVVSKKKTKIDAN